MLEPEIKEEEKIQQDEEQLTQKEINAAERKHAASLQKFMKKILSVSGVPCHVLLYVDSEGSIICESISGTLEKMKFTEDSKHVKNYFG